MRFFYNCDLNICGDMEWVINFLKETCGYKVEEIIEGLNWNREFEGWYECEVSRTISDKFYHNGLAL